MQVRSRMATWMLATTLVGLGLLLAPSWAAAAAPVKQKVKLDIQLSGGITSETGAEITIKPGHPACRFKAVTYPVKLNRQGLMPDILPIDVETRSADLDCSFLIVLREPGQPDKVFRRNLQLNPPTGADAGKPQYFLCYLSSKSGVVQAEPPAAKSVATTKPSAGPVRK